jgi:F-type H+-transporting ATPase subunit gamma
MSYFNFQKRPITQRVDVSDQPTRSDVDATSNQLIADFVAGKYDAVYAAYMNFISASQQKPDVMTLLPLAGVEGEQKKPATGARPGFQSIYEFSPDPKSLLDDLLPETVRSAVFQDYLDATTSEHVSRMIAMKSATDNADKMVKSLTMRYNRARQSQITTELSEIMGGVEAMKG